MDWLREDRWRYEEEDGNKRRGEGGKKGLLKEADERVYAWAECHGDKQTVLSRGLCKSFW